MEVTASSRKANSAIISPLVWDQTQEKKAIFKNLSLLQLPGLVLHTMLYPGHLLMVTGPRSSHF